jgi:HK97 family phage prohead protease
LWERYAPGCFARGLDGDCRSLFNHDENCVLGRASAGTAKFWEDRDGLRAEVDAPATTWASDLLLSIRRKDITGSSAAFWILDFRIENVQGKQVRVITRAVLRDASVCSIPQYVDSSATAAPALAAANPRDASLASEAELYREQMHLLNSPQWDAKTKLQFAECRVKLLQLQQGRKSTPTIDERAELLQARLEVAKLQSEISKLSLR